MTVEKTISTSSTEIIEIENGLHIFKTFDDEYYYKINITPDPKFSTLYDITIECLLNGDDDYQIKYRETNDDTLPWSIRNYFSGDEKIERITLEEFNEVKQAILDRIK